MHPHPTEQAPPEPRPIRILTLLHVLLTSRRKIVLLILGIVIPLALLQLNMARDYSVDASFVPQSRRTPNGLAGVASQLGISSALQTDANASPAFYADLVRSRALLGPIAAESVLVTVDGQKRAMTIADIYRIREKTSEDTRESVIERLSREVSSNSVQKTGVVNLRVTSNNPEVALAISRRLLTLLNEFNLNVRQSQASAERRFSENRLGEVSAALRRSEAELGSFLSSNRSVDESPTLRFEQESLEREVSLQQELYRTLSAAYEQARLDEVRDTPVITILQAPEYPVRPNSRGLIPKTMLALFLSTLVGVLWGISVRNTLAESEDEQHEREQVARLWQDTLSDFRRPWLIFKQESAHQ